MLPPNVKESDYLGLNVLSLFDGISCGRLALERAGIQVENYYASEIEQPVIFITQKHFPDTIQLGDVCKIDKSILSSLPKIDLLIGGSPCTDISVAKREKRTGLAGEKSKLFFEYYRILEWLKEFNNPDLKFLLENVKGSTQDIDAITECLGVDPILMDSKLVSAQIRKRYYWTNIENVKQPENKHIKLKDILESGYTEKEKAYCLTSSYGKCSVQNYFLKSERQHIFTSPVQIEKYPGMVRYIVNGANYDIYPTRGNIFNKPVLDKLKEHVRKLTPLECERLQTIPDNYTEGISNTDRYEALGNGWTVDVIAHILSGLKLNYISESNTINV